MTGFSGSFNPWFNVAWGNQPENAIYWTPPTALTGSPWTMEFFVLTTDTSSTITYCSCSRGQYYWNIGSSSGRPWLQFSTNGSGDGVGASTGSWAISYTGTSKYVSGTWNHIALCFTGTQYAYYLNGSQVATCTSSVDRSVFLNYINFNGLPINSSTAVNISYYTTARSFYVSNFRISCSARYTTSTYTTPVPPYTADIQTTWIQSFNGNVLATPVLDQMYSQTLVGTPTSVTSSQLKELL